MLTDDWVVILVHVEVSKPIQSKKNFFPMQKNNRGLPRLSHRNAVTLKYKLERLLVPVVAMPTFIGRANDHGSQANFQDAMLIEMRLRAVELYERGGILLNNDSLKELATKAKMPISLIPKVISHWIAENYLEKVEDCVLNLGSRYPEAKAMLLEAGEKIVKGSIAGKKRKAAIKRKYMGKAPDNKSSPTV